MSPTVNPNLHRKYRRVALEIIRGGPAHNQLLSPLTPYLALSNGSNVSELRVPYEHAELMRRLQHLRYVNATNDQSQASAEHSERLSQIQELAGSMSDVLEQIPGAIAAVSGARDEPELTLHLELVSSAAELAMLPIELCSALTNSATEHRAIAKDEFLLLDAQSSITLTRRVRGLEDHAGSWSSRPRVLFIAANPGKYQSIPYEEHLRHLLASLQPWIYYYDDPQDPTGTRKSYQAALDDVLHILYEASIEDIVGALENNEFTHVHILAHGIPDPNAPGRPIGLALHHPTDKTKVHVVRGPQLATALSGPSGAHRASLITLATCDSGQVADVVHSGASIARDLHRAGATFVLASQFPLTFRGSLTMLQSFYPAVLWGEDPRELLRRTRLRLHALHAGESHDWASVVAYANLPASLDDALDELRWQQARRATRCGFQALQDLVRPENGAVRLAADPSQQSGQARTLTDLLHKALRRIDDGIARTPSHGVWWLQWLSKNAAAEKVKSQVYFRFACAQTKNEPKHSESLFLQSRRHLELSLRYYDRAAHATLSPPKGLPTQLIWPHWAITQALVLEWILDQKFRRDRWRAAHLMTQSSRLHSDRVGQIWAMSTRLELYLLRYIANPGERAEHFAERARDSARDLQHMCDADRFPVDSTARQLRRYAHWWLDPHFDTVRNPTISRAPETNFEFALTLINDLADILDTDIRTRDIDQDT